MSGEIHSRVEDIYIRGEYPREETEIHIPVLTSTKQSLGCDLCKIKVTSSKILQRHLEGRRHKMRTERLGKIFKCELCDVTANSAVQLNIHLNSLKHKSRVEKQERADFTDIANSSKGLWIILFCAICIFINVVILFKTVS